VVTPAACRNRSMVAPMSLESAAAGSLGKLE
jgi:hypothetical protein